MVAPIPRTKRMRRRSKLMGKMPNPRAFEKANPNARFKRAPDRPAGKAPRPGGMPVRPTEPDSAKYAIPRLPSKPVPVATEAPMKDMGARMPMKDMGARMPMKDMGGHPGKSASAPGQAKKRAGLQNARSLAPGARGRQLPRPPRRFEKKGMGSK